MKLKTHQKDVEFPAAIFPISLNLLIDSIVNSLLLTALFVRSEARKNHVSQTHNNLSLKFIKNSLTF